MGPERYHCVGTVLAANLTLVHVCLDKKIQAPCHLCRFLGFSHTERVLRCSKICNCILGRNPCCIWHTHDLSQEFEAGEEKGRQMKDQLLPPSLGPSNQLFLFKGSSMDYGHLASCHPMLTSFWVVPPFLFETWESFFNVSVSVSLRIFSPNP